MDIVNKIIFETIVYAVPIILCTLGGLLAFRINIVNIGLEGFMIFGGLFSALAIYLTGSYAVGLLSCMIGSLILGLIYSVFSVTLKSNFIITGFAINLLALALSTYIIRSMSLTQIDLSIISISKMTLNIPLIEDIPILGAILSGHTPMVYLSVLIYILIIVFLDKIKIGTYVKVIGENEEAAQSAGIKIKLVKFITLTLSALIVGLGGFMIAVEQIRLFTPLVIAGTGFIAIAAFYCGNGKAFLSVLYALTFGLMKALSLSLAFGNQALEGLLTIMPYLAIIVVLTIVGIIKTRKKLERGVFN